MPASCALGPLIRMIEIAAGGRPLDKAKIVSMPQLKKGAITGATFAAPSQIIFNATHRITASPTQATQR